MFYTIFQKFSLTCTLPSKAPHSSLTLPNPTITRSHDQHTIITTFSPRLPSSRNTERELDSLALLPNSIPQPGGSSPALQVTCTTFEASGERREPAEHERERERKITADLRGRLHFEAFHHHSFVGRRRGQILRRFAVDRAFVLVCSRDRVPNIRTRSNTDGKRGEPSTVRSFVCAWRKPERDLNARVHHRVRRLFAGFAAFKFPFSFFLSSSFLLEISFRLRRSAFECDFYLDFVVFFLVLVVVGGGVLL